MRPVSGVFAWNATPHSSVAAKDITGSATPDLVMTLRELFVIVTPLIGIKLCLQARQTHLVTTHAFVTGVKRFSCRLGPTHAQFVPFSAALSDQRGARTSLRPLSTSGLTKSNVFLDEPC